MKEQGDLCKNCGTKLYGLICHNCGQNNKTKRWSTAILWKQFINQITNIEKGFFYTIKGLFLFPGRLVHDYWNGKTIKYYNPFRYLIILTAVSLIISYWIGIDEMLQASMEPGINDEGFSDDEIRSAEQKFDSWMNFLVLLLIPFNALLSWLLFKSTKNNYAEHLILNSYISGQHSILGSISSIFILIHPPLFSIFLPMNFLLGLIYNSYIFKRVFKQKMWLTILKAFIVGLLSITMFFILVMLFTTIALADSKMG